MVFTHKVRAGRSFAASCAGIGLTRVPVHRLRARRSGWLSWRPRSRRTTCARWSVVAPWAVRRLPVAHTMRCAHPHLASGVNAARDDTELATKQTKLLENKLEMSYIKLNEAMGRNKLIREDIDNLRRERCVFEQVRCRAAMQTRWPHLTAGLCRFTRSLSASCTTRSVRLPASSTSQTSPTRLAIRHAP